MSVLIQKKEEGGQRKRVKEKQRKTDRQTTEQPRKIIQVNKSFWGVECLNVEVSTKPKWLIKIKTLNRTFIHNITFTCFPENAFWFSFFPKRLSGSLTHHIIEELDRPSS